MNIDRVVLHAVLPKCDDITWAPLLTAALAEFEIATLDRAAMFLANLAHESRGLTVFEENLNYGAAGLFGTWPHLFTAETAAAYERQPERIANHVYANKYGNGDEASGDGWKYRGFGPIQLTFHDNHTAAGTALGLPLEAHPEMGKQPPVGSRTAGWFWRTNGLNELADAGDFEAVVQRINHAKLGLDEREAYLRRFKLALPPQ